MGDSASALMFYSLSRRTHGSETLRLLVDLRRDTEDWIGYLSTLTRLAERSGPADGVQLWVERARIERSVLERPADALESLDMALSLGPDNVETLGLGTACRG